MYSTLNRFSRGVSPQGGTAVPVCVCKCVYVSDLGNVLCLYVVYVCWKMCSTLKRFSRGVPPQGGTAVPVCVLYVCVYVSVLENVFVLVCSTRVLEDVLCV